MTGLSERFGRYVAYQWPEATDIQVEGLSRIHGGASRETYRLRLKLRRNGVAGPSAPPSTTPTAPSTEPRSRYRNPSGSRRTSSGSNDPSS
jgi:hypothetical protein